MPTHHRTTLWLVLIVLVAAVPKVVRFNAPFLDAYWMRDLMVASIAHNYLVKGTNLLLPETDYTPDKPNYIEMELPLTAALTAGVWRVTGENAWVPRLWSVLWSSGAIVLFFLLCRQFLGGPGALAATWLFALSPINLFMGRKFMPEPMTLCLSLACMWAFVGWLGAAEARGPAANGAAPRALPRTGWLVVAVLTGSLAALTKPPILHVLLPLGWLALYRRGWRTLLDPRHVVAVVALVLPTALWMRHAAALGQQYWSVGTTLAAGSWFSWEVALNSSFWSMMAGRFALEVLTPVGLAGLLLGLPLVSRRTPQFFFLVWLAAAAAYFLALLGGNARQTYYQLWFVAPAAGLAGYGWERLLAVMNGLNGGRGRETAPTTARPAAARALAVCLLVGLIAGSAWGVTRFYRQDTVILEAKAALDRLDPGKAPVIVYPAGYNCLYYLQRPGWCGRDVGRDYDMGAASRPPYVRERLARGARWALVFTTDPNVRDTAIEEYLTATYRRAHHDPGFDIYRLR